MQLGSVHPVDRFQGREPGWTPAGEGGKKREGPGTGRDREGPQTLSLVKDKSHCGDPGAARGGGKPGEWVVPTGQVVSRRREGSTVSEAAERSR